MNITVTKNPHPGTLPPSNQLGFGTVFTDHMFVMDYTEKDGWHNARVVPYGPIALSPRRQRSPLRHRGLRGLEGLPPPRR